MGNVLTHSAGDVVKQLLIDLGVATTPETYGAWPITSYQEADSPDNAITVVETVGRNDGRFQGNGEVQEHFGALIQVRATNPHQGSRHLGVIIQQLNENVNKRWVTLLDPEDNDAPCYYLVHAASYVNRNYLGKDVNNKQCDLFTTNYLVTITQESGT